MSAGVEDIKIFIFRLDAPRDDCEPDLIAVRSNGRGGGESMFKGGCGGGGGATSTSKSF